MIDRQIISFELLLLTKAFLITCKCPNLKYLLADASRRWVVANQEIIYVPSYIATGMLLLPRFIACLPAGRFCNSLRQAWQLALNHVLNLFQYSFQCLS
jgi:hypothetical protein